MLRLIVTASRHRPDRRQQRHVEREIRQRHHGRSRDRAARPDELVAVSLPHAAAAEPDLLDGQSAFGMERLRKFCREKPLQLLDSHDWRAHINSLPHSRAAARIGYNVAPHPQSAWMTVMNAPTKTPSAEAILLREDVSRGDLGKIAILTLNRPAARNALSEALLLTLSESLRDNREGPRHPRGGAGRERAGFLRRPRPEGADGAPQRCRRRPRLFPVTS